MMDQTNARRLIVTVEPERKGFSKLCPRSDGRFGQWQIIFNPVGLVEADYWLVFGNARPSDQILVAPENTQLVVLEPESKKVYPKKYYRQFGRVVDTHSKSAHPQLSVEAPCFSWHVGLTMGEDRYTLGYDELSSLACPPDRKNKISVVCSDANFTEGQRQRLVFLKALKSRLGDRMDHYGRGFNPINDKMEGIFGYRLHLVMENCSAQHYWTEKLIDSYLGWAYPFYLGCPNVSDYFPLSSFQSIDSMDPGLVAELILARLDEGPNDEEMNGLKASRDLVLNTYNPFIRWANWADHNYQPNASKEWTTIHSHKAFRPYLQGLLFQFKSRKLRKTGADVDWSIADG